MNVDLKPFDRFDWDSFSGCESKNPLIDRDVMVDDASAILIVDGNRIQVYAEEPAGSWWDVEIPANWSAAEVASLFPKHLTSGRLKMLGFKQEHWVTVGDDDGGEGETLRWRDNINWGEDRPDATVQVLMSDSEAAEVLRRYADSLPDRGRGTQVAGIVARWDANGSWGPDDRFWAHRIANVTVEDDDCDWANELSMFVDELLTKHTSWAVEHPAEVAGPEVGHTTLDCLLVNEEAGRVCVRVTFERLV